MDGLVVSIHDGKINRFFPKKVQNENFNYTDTYQTVNVYRFSLEEFKTLIIPNIVQKIENGFVNDFYETVIADQIHANEYNLAAEIVDKKLWFEIDNKTDLEMAQKTKFA